MFKKLRLCILIFLISAQVDAGPTRSKLLLPALAGLAGFGIFICSSVLCYSRGFIDGTQIKDKAVEAILSQNETLTTNHQSFSIQLNDTKIIHFENGQYSVLVDQEILTAYDVTIKSVLFSETLNLEIQTPEYTFKVYWDPTQKNFTLTQTPASMKLVF